jgi:hypothetical protein
MNLAEMQKHIELANTQDMSTPHGLDSKKAST